MVKELQSLGKTVFLTTHYMDEAQYLADRVAIIARGQLVAEGAPHALIGSEQLATTIRFRLPPDLDISLPEGLPQAQRSAEGAVSIETDEPTQALFALTRWAIERGVALQDLTVGRPSLEDVYLRLVSEADEQEAAS
jgi:ABC-2 type transport system ATP-binding protein